MASRTPLLPRLCPTVGSRRFGEGSASSSQSCPSAWGCAPGLPTAPALPWAQLTRSNATRSTHRVPWPGRSCCFCGPYVAAAAGTRLQPWGWDGAAGPPVCSCVLSPPAAAGTSGAGPVTPEPCTGVTAGCGCCLFFWAGSGPSCMCRVTEGTRWIPRFSGGPGCPWYCTVHYKS